MQHCWKSHVVANIYMSPLGSFACMFKICTYCMHLRLVSYQVTVTGIHDFVACKQIIRLACMSSQSDLLEKNDRLKCLHVSMIRKYHNNKLQTNPLHREEEPHNNHETPGRQTKQSNQLSLPHQDDCLTEMDTK